MGDGKDNIHFISVVFIHPGAAREQWRRAHGRVFPVKPGEESRRYGRGGFQSGCVAQESRPSH